MIKKKSDVTVIFDTNKIFPEAFIPNEIHEGIQEINKKENIKVEWFIPEVVYEEGLEHFRLALPKEINGYYCSFGNIKKIFDINFPDVEYGEEKNIPILYKQMISNSGIRVLKMKWREIDIRKLMLMACRKEGVFQEEGFQDALILECIKQFLNKEVEDGGNNKTIFVSDDKGLRKILKERFPSIEIKENWEQANSYLKLLNTKQSEKDITELINKANIFFKEELYEEYKICEKIKEDNFRKILENPRKSGIEGFSVYLHKLELVEENIKCGVLDTNFSRKYRGETYSWETNILVDVTYDIIEEGPPWFHTKRALEQAMEPINMTNQKLTEIGIPIYSSGNQIDLTADPIKNEEVKEKIIHFRFKVMWNSKIDEQGSIISPKFLNLKFESQYSPLQPFIIY